MKYRVAVSGQSFEIEVEHDCLVRVNGRPYYVDLEQIGGLPLYSLGLEDQGYVLFVEEGQEVYEVEVQGQRYPVQVRPERAELGAQPARCADSAQCEVICAPLAGRLVALPAHVGDQVEAGQVLVVMESMKMLMELKATGVGIVESVQGAPGRDVGQGEELVRLQMSRT